MQVNKKHFRHFGFIITVTVITMLAACGLKPLGGNSRTIQRAPLAALALSNPQSCSAYKDYISSSLVKSYTTIPRYSYYGCNKYSGGRGGAEPITAGSPEASLDASTGLTPPPSGPTDVSQTNNQEAGVNESDTVKVDSKTGAVFIAHSKYLLIADAFPPQQMSLIKQIDMKAEVVDLLYDESNQRLTVVTRYHDPIVSP